MDSVTAFDELANAVPEAQIIMGHGLSAGPLTDIISLLKRHENLTADTSFAPDSRTIEKAAMEVGEKLVFGSDHPYSNMKFEILKVKIADIPEDQKSNILSGNIAKILNLNL